MFSVRILLLLAGLWSAPVLHADVRIVSLSPNLTELLFDLDLGAHMVGRSSACDYPVAALAVPVAGAFGRPNLEALLQLKPDVVLVTDLEKPGILRPLELRGIDVRVLPCESWTQLETAVTAMAEIVGQPDRAVQWIDAQRRARQSLAARVAAYWQERSRPTLYVEVWGSPPTSVGGSSFLHQVIELAGGRNIAGGLNVAYPTISSEWVIEENPQVILLAYMLDDMRPAESMRRRLGWSRLMAVQQQRVIDDILPDLLLRPGPRLIHGAGQLADRLMQLDPVVGALIE